MASALGSVTGVLQDTYSWARKAKQEGRKVVGITPMHFPEELIHAAGALPVVLQESYEPVTVGFGHIYPIFCGYSRSNVDIAAKGRLDFLDAVVISDMCLQTRHSGFVMKRRIPNVPFAYIQWPLEVREPRWVETTVGRIERLRGELERLLGTKITDEALSASMALYSEHRALLQRLYAIRQEKPGIIKAKELMSLVQSGMVMPKEQHVAILREVIADLEARPAPMQTGVKLFLSGHLCQAVKVDVLDLIENLGGVVVGDDLFTGYRYFATELPEGATPVERLARRYLSVSVPCPTRADRDLDWGEYVVQASKKAGAQGVVALVVKFCEPHMIYYPHLRAVLEKNGLPHVRIETEHEVVSMEGIRTRVQALIEMLKK